MIIAMRGALCAIWSGLVLSRLLRRLWGKIQEWLGIEPEPFDIPALPPLQPFDWFTWECELHSATGAWWFDPWRYEGTPYAYPDPSQESIRANFKRCEMKARQKYGDWDVDHLGKWCEKNLEGEYNPHSSVAHQTDPVEWAMIKYRESII